MSRSIMVVLRVFLFRVTIKSSINNIAVTVFLNKQGIDLDHVKCKENKSSNNQSSKDILNHVYYYFISDNSDQYGATTATHKKTTIK